MQITYEDKVALTENTEIADINKVKADDMNMIKSVVNANQEDVGDISNLKTEDISSIVNAINEIEKRNYYSTEEIQIGWFIKDGIKKPYYRKRFDVTSKVDVDLSSLNYDFIDIVSTMLEVSNYRRNPYYSSSSDYFRVLINPAKKLIIESNVPSFTRWTTTLEYTKTTDEGTSV